MVQKYFLDSWLLPCSLRSHRTAHPTPTHHPSSEQDNEYLITLNNKILC